MAEVIPCKICGAPGRMYRTHPFPLAKAGFELLDEGGGLCVKHARVISFERMLHLHPKGYDYGKAAYLDAVRKYHDKGKPPPAAVVADILGEAPKEDEIAAAVQRLMQTAREREDTAPTPRSPNWIGKELEEEGWSRRVLLAAIDRAKKDGDLVPGFYLDEWRHRKRALRPAPTGVPVEITF